MNIPPLKTVRQWLPMIGGGVFTLWTGLLVLLSLFPSEEPADWGASAAPGQGAGCVRMRDGFLICDELSNRADAGP